jgi:predicted RNA-binding Zn ribbon-like protein
MQAPYGRSGAIAEIQRREEASWQFIDSPSTQSLEPLCDAGVDWLWVDPNRTSTRDWSSFAKVGFEAEDVIVLEIKPSAC